MGEVYRATDTKLGREVALKLLPEAVAKDPERLARFEREAKVLASLNHPNIASIHAIESAVVQVRLDAPLAPQEKGKATLGERPAGPVHFLVMELAEGEDLAEKIAKGPIPVDEILPIASQMADALEVAHESGIIHRDLKPANIKVDEDGQVKVLDFGLAKALDPAAGGSADSDPAGTEAGRINLSMSPTLTAPMTGAGVILGTAAYMAPEQAKGKTVDKRADIWAFGVVLFEMLTGKRLFEAESVAETLGAIFQQEIDPGELPPDAPPRLRRLIGRCLERDPRLRLRDIGEARVALSSLDETESPSTADQSYEQTRRSSLTWLPIAAGALLVGLAIGILGPWQAGRTQPSDQRPSRTFVLAASGRTINDTQAISPDGKWVAYSAAGSLWIRNLGQLEPREVPGSDGASWPFWSPRSEAVAFAAGNSVFAVSLESDRMTELCQFSGGDFTGGSWSALKGIVFTLSRANWDGDVLRIPEGGGEPEVFTQADPSKGERRLQHPHFLPDGNRILYSVVTFEANEGELALDTDGDREQLGFGNGATQPAVSSTGHIVFTRRLGASHNLWATPVSLETFTSTGEEFRVAAGGAAPSVSDDGTLLFSLRQPAPHQLTWVDRAGQNLGTLGEPQQSNLWEPSISPDGSQVEVSVDLHHITVWDVARGLETRVTSESEEVIFGSWLPHGKEIAFVAHSGGFRIRRADGSGEPRVLLDRSGVAMPAISRDGAFMVFYIVDPEMGRDLWAMPMDKPDEAFLVLQTPANEARPVLSPDGKLLAYQSDTSGRWEIYVQPFPTGEGRWQISVDGGQHPTWNPTGDELFFTSGNDLMAVDVVMETDLQIGTPARLFSGQDVGTNLRVPRMIESLYDVAPDGNRFIVIQGVGMGASDIVLSDGWLQHTAAE